MKKKGKKLIFQLKSFFFFTIIFWLLFWLCISKMILYSLQRCSYNISNHSKWRRIEKDLPKCLVIGRQSMMGQYTLHMIRLTTNSDNSGNVPIFGSTLHKCSKFISNLCEVFSIDQFILVSNFEESLWDNPIWKPWDILKAQWGVLELLHTWMPLFQWR